MFSCLILNFNICLLPALQNILISGMLSCIRDSGRLWFEVKARFLVLYISQTVSGRSISLSSVSVHLVCCISILAGCFIFTAVIQWTLQNASYCAYASSLVLITFVFLSCSINIWMKFFLKKSNDRPLLQHLEGSLGPPSTAGRRATPSPAPTTITPVPGR